MFKIRTIVISVWSACAIIGCASLEQPSHKTGRALAYPESKQSEFSAEQLYQIGRQYQGEGRYDEAVAIYLKAIERDHRLADAHNAVGVLYAEQGRYDDAISEFTSAIELKPGVAYLHNNLGYAFLLRGSNREALSPLEIALHLDPVNEKALFNLCLAHERLGDLAPKSSRAAIAPDVAPIQAGSDLDKSGMQTETTNSAQLVAVAPSIYEIKMGTRTQPEVAGVTTAVIKERPLSPSLSEPGVKSRRFKLEISNGNGTPGLARRVARMLDQNGVRATRLTNHATFRQASTEIQYRKGYLAEASRLREIFLAEVKPVSSSSLRRDIHVRVLLGKDLSRTTVLRLRPEHSTVIAHAAPAQQK